MEEINFGLHWLAFTIHAPKEQAFLIYDILFKENFGAMESMGHGGRGFREIHHSLLEFKIYSDPVHNNGEYFHYEIPGQACELIKWDYFQALLILLDTNFPELYSFTRFDFAFDNCNFTPEQVQKEIENDRIRSLAKRETLTVNHSPFAIRDNGELGTYTVNFGSRQSERMIRVYNKRGFTRLEFEIKNDRAQLIAKELLSAEEVSKWFPIMISHLRDYIDFEADWWNEFTSSHARAWATLSTPKELSMTKLLEWMDRQVMPAFSVVKDVLPEGAIEIMITRGRKRRGDRYNLLLANAEIKGGTNEQ